MIKYLRRSIKDQTTKTIKKFKPGLWIYVESPDEYEIKKLAERFNLDVGLLTDAIDPYEIPRLEIDEEAYIFSRTPVNENGIVSSTPILFVLGKDFFITIVQKKIPLFDKFFEDKVVFSTTQKFKFFVKIFSEINASYQTTLTNINKKLSHVMGNIENIKNKDITELIGYEQIANDLLSRLIQINGVLSVVSAGRLIKFNEEDKDLVEDIYLANGQLIDLTKNTLQSVKNLRDSYSTILTNNLNRVIKLLTTITVIFTIPTMVAGLWGMNVQVPFQESPYAFAMILGIVGILCGLLLFIFNKKDWF